MTVRDDIHSMGRAARDAARAMARADTGTKNAALGAIAERLLAQRARLSEANRADLAAARENRLAEALLDRLELTPARLEAMAGRAGAGGRPGRPYRGKYRG